MKALCTICSDLFDGTNSVIASPCGHTFHEICFLQWLEESRTCPSCRTHVTHKKIVRLFFDISEDLDNQSSDALKNELESVKVSLKAKEMELWKADEKVKCIQEYVRKAEAKAECEKDKYLESEAQKTALKSQLKVLTKQVAQIERISLENLNLKKQLIHMKNVELIISGSTQEVEEILNSYSDGAGALKQMATYCSLLKRELQSTTESKQCLKNDVSRLKKDLGCRTSALHEKEAYLKSALTEIAHLKQTIEKLEGEKKYLEKKVVITDDLFSMSNNSSSSLSLVKSPESASVKRPRLTNPENIDFSTEKFSPNHLTRTSVKKLKMHVSSVNQSCTPVISVHQPRVTENIFKPLRSIQPDEESVLRKGYNGLGGHSTFVCRSRNMFIKSKPLIRRKPSSKEQANQKNTLDQFM
ncbi:E3 ubiquitin-protein ligase TRAIP-like [Limulus polyphemus]|uniref:E3 ubiquitin-protein ligase TRAIP-like n=1 Tax=Limulus polyphemus TaxID=6850 RepID=A0ABM1T210_LIMPO|nr:E3 ubiquitin-protein ligase TRAIP-like [Limulus polyphemus]XP_022249914.1 E3 ubiquitin-protein ligase TRAIP-like [Limulus polyphemus]XP_022249915.1 E3 ubiquitin-protein ligase TRAIP-like [Limulus polyphemus]XP_022249916.1 E3 ubiquitin-protein ligase TRAIP-like [Limulus polyphemus]XP_022249918.1 E3 ubiquitin-protein ligase TRAIP-like [Limulus polyphemus]XP_022249919.1 E3 ubiquitin-protein ligase TRAIP-like [Limulus polyphemus]